MKAIANLIFLHRRSAACDDDLDLDADALARLSKGPMEGKLSPTEPVCLKRRGMFGRRPLEAAVAKNGISVSMAVGSMSQGIPTNFSACKRSLNGKSLVVSAPIQPNN